MVTFFGVRASDWANAPDRDGSVATIDARAGDLLEVALSPDGGTVATGGWGETVTVWDVRSRQRRHTLQGHTDRIMGLARSAPMDSCSSRAARTRPPGSGIRTRAS